MYFHFQYLYAIIQIKLHKNRAKDGLEEGRQPRAKKLPDILHYKCICECTYDCIYISMLQKSRVKLTIIAVSNIVSYIKRENEMKNFKLKMGIQKLSVSVYNPFFLTII